MKKNIIYTLFGLFLMSIILYTACKKDDNTDTTDPNPAEAYQVDEAAVMMTLSAIAYTNEAGSVQGIKDSIIALLKNTALATAGEWDLTWGPGVNATNSNLVYVARNTITQKETYTIVVRGTSPYSISDILQDVEVFTLVPFKYGMPGDSVAIGSMEGLDILLVLEDPESGKTLKEYLNGNKSRAEKKMFITGHSQGGALAPLMTYWFIRESGVIDQYELECYAFAGPSVSNETYRVNFLNSLPQNAHFHMVANPLDIVPYFWARFDSLVSNSIPSHVPLFYRALLEVASMELNNHNIHYVQLNDPILIGSFPPKDTLGTIHPSDTIQWYDHWVMEEHIHNNYLRLLGAEEVR